MNNMNNIKGIGDMGGGSPENGGGRAQRCSDTETRAGMLKRIQALSFAKTETELYLDAHPDATAALEYYSSILEKLDKVTEKYEEEYGPITASAAAGETWRWVSGKWPWQYGPEEEN